MIRAIDPRSIASVRRFFGLLFVSTLIWLVPVAISIPFSSLLHGAVANEFIFGAFLAWGFELVIIRAAFLRSFAESLLVAAIHPIPILVLALSASAHGYLLPTISGLLVLLVLTAFISTINSVKTKNGISSLDTLRAFLKTWVEHNPAELETYFSGYAKVDSVTTDVIIAQSGERRLTLVLPGIHPGPFSPVGSYNLSELIYGELKDSTTAPVVLHGTGGHERNVPTNKIASDYASEISRFVKAQHPTEKVLMRGPLRSKVGITNIATLAFGKAVLTIVSNSPFLSDDLDPTTVADAFDAAAALGSGRWSWTRTTPSMERADPKRRFPETNGTASLAAHFN